MRLLSFSITLICAALAVAERSASSEPSEVAFELVIEEVKPLDGVKIAFAATTVDPRYALTGRINWTERPEIFPRRSRQVFGIDSPVRMGLGTAPRPGNTICLLVRSNVADGKTAWLLRPIRPDAHCPNGG